MRNEDETTYTRRMQFMPAQPESPYRTPSANPDGVAIEIAVDRVLGSGD